MYVYLRTSRKRNRAVGLQTGFLDESTFNSVPRGGCYARLQCCVRVCVCACCMRVVAIILSMDALDDSYKGGEKKH